MRLPRGSRGQGLVEFALVFPLFFVLLLAIFDFGRVVWARNSLENAVREAARYAIVHGGSELTTCPMGPDALGRTVPFPDPCPWNAGGVSYASPWVEPVKQVGRSWATAAGDSLVFTVCYGDACTGDTSTALNAPGTPVTVRASSSVTLIVGNLVGFFGYRTFSLDTTVTMLVNT
jgi:hypothetical protein